MEDINLLLSYIETEIIEGKKSLFGNGVVVDGKAILGYLKRIRYAVSLSLGENVLNEAVERAQKIIETAEKRRAEILKDSLIVAEAERRAASVVADAEKRKESVEQKSVEKITEMLTEVKNTLADGVASINAAIERIDSPSRPAQ